MRLAHSQFHDIIARCFSVMCHTAPFPTLQVIADSTFYVSASIIVLLLRIAYCFCCILAQVKLGYATEVLNAVQASRAL
jgi:hypothetical protein